MNDPCKCWEPSNLGDMTGATIVKIVGGKEKTRLGCTPQIKCS